MNIEFVTYSNNENVKKVTQKLEQKVKAELESWKEPKIYSVWVGAFEVNNYYLTKEDAIDLAEEYRDDGYDDVIIREEFNHGKS